MAKKKRAYSLSNIRDYEPKTVSFEGDWYNSIGNPEIKGSWIIWGNSANGKTSFALQLAMYMTNFGKVIYNSIEEGLSQSIQDAISRVSVGRLSNYRFQLFDKVSVDELRETLRKPKTAKVVFIDSLQYTGLSYSEYKCLRDEFPNKLFIFVSHADGKLPKGEVAKSVRYDAFVKIFVEGYKAFPQSRFGGGEPFVIWEKGADKYWNKKNNKDGEGEDL